MAVGRDPQQRVGRAEGAPEGAPAATEPPAGLVDVDRACAARIWVFERGVGSASASPVRCTIASTVPVDRSTPNSSLTSSTRSRLETRLRTESVATAASSRGPNAPAGTPAGSSARVIWPQPGQQTRWSRCSVTTTLIGGSSADLMTRRLTDRHPLLLAEHVTAAAPRRPMLNELVDTLERLEPSTMAGMTRLPARPTLRRRPLPLRRARRILARRQRRVPRAPVQPTLKLLHPSRQLLDLRILSSDPLRQRHQHPNNSITTLLVDRLRLNPLHTTRFAAEPEDPSTN